MNHTAREHAWAQAARAGSRRHRDYYLVFPDRTMPDRYEATLPEVFPELAPGSFTWEPELDGWVWTTFNSYQWDLNYANPDVFVEMFRVMVDLANLGVEVLRLDAIAVHVEATGHELPEPARGAPARPGLSRAAGDRGPRRAPEGRGDRRADRPRAVPRRPRAIQRDECHLAYHNQLMVMIWSSLATQDATLASEALASLPPTPSATNWVTYLRCHDDIGWAVSDEIAARLGVSGPAHRAYLAAFFRGEFPGSYARGAAFSTNPDIGDERTVGSAAALCGITAARASGDEEALELGIRRLLLAYGVVLGFGGIPLLYMGDEIAARERRDVSRGSGTRRRLPVDEPPVDGLGRCCSPSDTAARSSNVSSTSWRG